MASKSDDITDATKAADLNGTQDIAVQTAIEKALTEATGTKTFNTHSQALAGRLIAEERALVEIVADIDAKIAELNEQRTDAMLAHSMISHALTAAQKGAK